MKKKSLKDFGKILKNLRSNNQLFGGALFLIMDDFRQTLPVVTKGTGTDEVNACLKCSVLWKHIIKLHLKLNMRAESGD